MIVALNHILLLTYLLTLAHGSKTENKEETKTG